MINSIASQRRRISGPAGGGLVDATLGSAGRPYSVIRLGHVVRLALMLTPASSGSLAEQVAEILAALGDPLSRHEWPLTLTTQTVFLRDAADQAACEQLFAASVHHRTCVTHFVVQPPGGGSRLAVEAWAIGGPGVTVQRRAPGVVRIDYDGIGWIHTSGVAAADTDNGVYETTRQLFLRTGELLGAAGAAWPNVVRTWWYLGGITGAEGGGQRYQELNRARSDAFGNLQFGDRHLCVAPGHTGFPASTGIGMERGAGVSLATLALMTFRSDVSLVPLENPLQTPAYDYAACYSPKSPKFSRAMALVTPEYVTTWISGTASIVNSEVLYPDSVVAQTEQTLDNIAALIGAPNFASHGVSRAGASLRDLAKVRVYVKRAADYAACRAVCERRLGSVPAVFVVADVCRPELLVEIEGVAFSRRPAPRQFDERV